jgi:hypothetical protein
MKARIVTMFSFALLIGCAPKSGWYEESSEYDRVNKRRVEEFKLQGMDEVKAKQTMIYETYWRNTEIGHRKYEPVEGNDLKDAISRPAP